MWYSSFIFQVQYSPGISCSHRAFTVDLFIFNAVTIVVAGVKPDCECEKGQNSECKSGTTDVCQCKTGFKPTVGTNAYICKGKGISLRLQFLFVLTVVSQLQILTSVLARINLTIAFQAYIAKTSMEVTCASALVTFSLEMGEKVVLDV